MEYVIYADESAKSGKYFANFYGGILITSAHIDEVRDRLSATATELNLTGEIKWQKVSGHYLGKYMAMVDALFAIVGEGKAKLRIMFTQTRHVPTGLTPEQRENEYFLLYYQFIKHAFGLQHSNPCGLPVRLRLYFDRLPDTREKAARFKAFLVALARWPEFEDAGILIPGDQIAEVDSHEHIVLQCLDVVLGAMQFRLNDLHLEKPEGAVRRGNRTIAKEKLYKHINRHVRALYPNFNIGVSTGTGGDRAARWTQPYRHWLFVPAQTAVDPTRKKQRE